MSLPIPANTTFFTVSCASDLRLMMRIVEERILSRGRIIVREGQLWIYVEGDSTRCRPAHFC